MKVKFTIFVVDPLTVLRRLSRMKASLRVQITLIPDAQLPGHGMLRVKGPRAPAQKIFDAIYTDPDDLMEDYLD